VILNPAPDRVVLITAGSDATTSLLANVLGLAG
jgi:hypothetical protein